MSDLVGLTVCGKVMATICLDCPNWATGEWLDRHAQWIEADHAITANTMGDLWHPWRPGYIIEPAPAFIQNGESTRIRYTVG